MKDLMQQANTYSKRLALTLALAMFSACGSDDEGSGTAAVGGVGGMTGGVGGATGGVGGATGGVGGATGGVGGATGGMGGVAGMMVSGGMGGMTGGAGGMTGGTGGMGTGGMGTGGMGAGGMGTGGMSGGMFTLTSTAFTDDGMLPATHRCESLFGAGGPSPALMWSGAPAGTMSFALTLTDNSNDFAHWTIYDIPAATTSLPMNVMAAAMPAMPAGAKQGANTAPLAGPGYFGPCGGTSNPYEFTLYAIDAATLGVAADADRATVQAAIDMHDLGSVSITAMSGP
jgi:Raf kinase inhibitor-like YbhB/YbcL family protein